ncbi:MAG TPA: SDR family oxidoreductase [Leptolyngbyaceae cyanobacterium M33_DOE_097]|uniref:SDR family oxidoreductase n=1 Tax=Oscillatoriales cyanobacterium SpSt-418 TaxID=2282169 RepID=A0A7C3PIN2_9CYAN|nr:SDR family oxidoreductase [Leptolyngbyaceae cyanobacterium M33_DOE_097]
MAKTVFVTGASSGIGKATVDIFQRNGWNVVATMRSPETATDLTEQNVLRLRLDVTESGSIQAAVEAAIAKFGSIDVLVNNAGYALIGTFEACTPEQIQRQFETNVFGLMNVTRAVLPGMRDRNTGTIINLSSIGGRMAFPLYSLYHATKWAVDGFSDSLQYELEPFNIRVRIIEPGPIKTDFYSRSLDLATQPHLTAYDAIAQKVLPNLKRIGETGSPPEVTAAVIYQAAIDPSKRLRYPAGGNASALLALRKYLPDVLFKQIVRYAMLR